jgi:CDP-diacylglycerol--glycerol-3-phosphate 3-phosphatidyltransferase
MLTAFRVLLGPAFLVAYGRIGHTWLLFLVVGLAMVTDWLDGLTARKLQAVSLAGTLLDPFADALFCMIVFVDFAIHGLMPWWVTVLLLFREATVLFALRPIALVRGIVVAASALGKIKTSLQFVAMLLVLFALASTGTVRSVVNGLAQISFFAVLVFSLGSAAKYVYDVRAGLCRPRESPVRERATEEGR